MNSPHLGLGLAPPPSADPSAAPPSRRAPRLAKRRHAATTPRSRAQPSTSAPSWNPFGGGGGTDASGQDGTAAGSGSVDGGGGSGFRKGHNEGFVFGSAPAARQQSPPPPPPVLSSNEAPFVFGSVRDSLPRFDEGTSAASKLDDMMGKMNLRSAGKCSVGVGKGVDKKDKSYVFGVTTPSLASDREANALPEKLTQLNIGTGAPSQNEGANSMPKTFMFGSTGAGSFADSRSIASSYSDSQASSSVQVTEANGVPESGHADSTNNVAHGGVNTNASSADCGTDDASALPEKITQLNIGSGTFQYVKDGGSGSHQTEVFRFGGGGTADNTFGNASRKTSDKGNVFVSSASSNPSSSNGAANLPLERASNLNVGGGVTQSMRSNNANCPPEAFVFGRNGSTNSASQHPAHGNLESTLSEKMTSLNIQHRIPSQSMKDEAATRQPEQFVFGSSATSSSSMKTTFTSFQTYVSSETKDGRKNLASDDTRGSTYSKSNNDKGYMRSNFVFGSGSSATARSEVAAEHALQDDIKKLNINREGPSVGSVRGNDASTPAFSFQTNAEATPGYCTVPQPKVQESCPVTPLNHSSSFSNSAKEIPAFSSNLMNSGRGSVPSAVKPDQASCSRESLFGIDYIKSAYRDKKEAHKSTRKKKRPTRLKQHAQIHQVCQETCTDGPNSDLRGDYSPMDCSPYQAAVEQLSRETSVGCDQSIHMHDSSVSNQNTSCAEDDLVSATEYFVIDARLPTYQDEGRDPIADASESNFGSNFSSFDEEINFCDRTQPLFTNMSADANGEPKMYTTEAWVDGFECNISGQTCKENTSSERAVNTQSSSEDLSGLNFTFGASLYPESSFSAQRRTTKRKLRTKGSQVPKPSATQASVQPKSSEDTKSMQFSPETSETESSVKEQLRRDASILADLDTCETWRTSGNQAYANGHFATAEGCYTRGINSISQYGTSGRFSRALMLCYSNRAATRMSLGRMREALQDCSTATSIDPTFLKAKVRSANCQLALGDLEGALSNYRACLKSSNTADFNIKISAEASNGLESVKRVADCIAQSRELLKKRTLPDAKTALDFISSALEISSHSDNLMEMKAEALMTLRRYEEVIELCQETVDLAERNASGEPNNSSASGKAECSVTLWRPYLICKSYFLLGKLEEALDLLKRHELAPVKESDGSTYRYCFSSLSTSIRQLLSFKAAGNESFQARRYLEAVEQYSAALACNSDSRPFSAVCFCNRAAAYQALGQLTDAIADCSLAMVLDANYPKAISRRATLYEMIRDYGQSANDLRKLISLIQKQANKPGVSPKVVNKHSDLKQARARLLAVEDEARKDTPLNLYLILGVEPSCSPADIKKAYRKAALRHHPDKATQLLIRNENADDGFWRDVAKEVYSDADHLFKTIGEAYNILSDPDKREEYEIEENLRNAARRAFKGRSTQRSPEQHYRRQYDTGFSPRQWQSAGQSNKGAPRSRWSGYEYSGDYW